ncbi:MAG TPA: hypothetical protein VGG48_17860 [Rhizomicrobium sp.]|jgi:hypothetical protein
MHPPDSVSLDDMVKTSDQAIVLADKRCGSELNIKGAWTAHLEGSDWVASKIDGTSSLTMRIKKSDGSGTICEIKLQTD